MIEEGRIKDGLESIIHKVSSLTWIPSIMQIIQVFTRLSSWAIGTCFRSLKVQVVFLWCPNSNYFTYISLFF